MSVWRPAPLLLFLLITTGPARAFVPPPFGALQTAGMVSIPATKAKLGGHRTVGTETFDAPQHDVDLQAFSIDGTEVTVAAYAQCVSAGKCAVPAISLCEVNAATTYGVPGLEAHPINCVSYAEAAAYCAFAGKRLPTGPEWEVALRGPTLSTFPWGNDIPKQGMTNGCDHSCEVIASAKTGFSYSAVWPDKSFDDGFAFTAPVGRFASDVSAYGVFDLAANLAEWVNPTGEADLGGTVVFTPNAPLQGDKQLRGGSWATNVYSTMTYAGRDRVDGSFRGGWVGFRCAK